jgi:hypothetical protein
MKLLGILTMVLLVLPLAYAVTEPAPNCCRFCVGAQCTYAPTDYQFCMDMKSCSGASCPGWTIDWVYSQTCNFNCNEVPEFGTVTALVALAGATTGYFIMKKK